MGYWLITSTDFVVCDPVLLEPLGQLVWSDILPQAFFAAAGAGLQLPVLIVETVTETRVYVNMAFGQQDFI